jgi:pimeloyl-ACP methyl ester carboxylesterase
MGRGRIGVAVVIAAITGVTSSALGSSGSAEPSAPAKAGAKLGPCPKHARPRRLRCGTIEVPYERADPSLGTTRVRFAVRRRGEADAPAKRPIFAVEGGPGYGSISSARYYIHMFGPVLRRHDLVLVDMRGTGHSRAINCPKLQKGSGTDRDGVAECARILGDHYESYRTSAAADDIDDVRRTLGLGRIDLYGDSYGTFLAGSYAYRHGDSLAALVLDSAYPVRGESPWYPSLWQNGVRALQIACNRAAACSGNAYRRLGRMVARLRRTPRGVGPLLDAIASGGYEPPLRNFLKIDEAISAYLHGNRRPYKRLTEADPGPYGIYRAYSRGDELAVSCNDYPMLWDKRAGMAERRRQLHAAVRKYPQGAFKPFTPREVALESVAGYTECQAWPKPSPLYEPPAPVGARAPRMPTLVISGELDNVTSPVEAASVADHFADARLRIARNGGHVPSLYGGRYKARDWVRRFVDRHG